MNPVKSIFILLLPSLVGGIFPTPLPAQPVRFYSEPLDSDPGWTAESDWAFGPPTGEGGCHTPPNGCPPDGGPGVWGYPDPDSGYTGDNVYGYNLDGNYPAFMAQTEYLITRPPIDCRGYRSIKLSYYRWLNVERRPNAMADIDVSSDGLNWINIFENHQDGRFTVDSDWVHCEYNISQYADNQETVYIRWGMGPTKDEFYTASGWNIDDIELWGVPPSPTPVPTATPTPTPFGYQTPSPTASPVPTTTPTATPTATPSPSPSVTPTPTPVPTASPSPSTTPTPSATPTMIPTASPVPSPSPGEPVRIYSFPLDSDPGWTTQSAWAFGRPRGGGEIPGFYPNPTYAHTGYNVYGFNLAGGYGAEMPPYSLTTTPIDCSGLVKTRLAFSRWLNIERSGLDRAAVRVSANGTNWTTVWENPANDWVRDCSWVREEYDISSIADGRGTVYIRWVMGPTDEFVNASGWNLDDIEIWGVPSGPTPFPTPTPLPTPRRPFPLLDYSGNGTSDIAIFRPVSGLWAVRGVTRAYFGAAADLPVPGDYNGDGTAELAIFRAGSGLWAVRGVTRAYFGGGGDLPRPAEWRWNGKIDIAIFRPVSGLWAVRGVTRFYFGSQADQPVEGYYAGLPAAAGIFRPASGLWAVRGVTRFYFGGPGDRPLPGDYDGLGRWQPAIFRPASGLWAIRGLTRRYFGGSADLPVPGGYGGARPDRIAVFRPAAGLWAVRKLTRVYFGSENDLPAAR